MQVGDLANGSGKFFYLILLGGTGRCRAAHYKFELDITGHLKPTSRAESKPANPTSNLRSGDRSGPLARQRLGDDAGADCVRAIGPVEGVGIEAEKSPLDLEPAGSLRAVGGLTVKPGHFAAMDFEIFVSPKIFDRNSNVRFHKCMVATGLQKSPAHDLMHSQLFNRS